MAKISANTISGASFSGANAQHIPPNIGSIANVSGSIGATYGAAARTLDTRNHIIDNLTRQKVNNLDRRTRELQQGIATFTKGATSMLGDIEEVMQKRAERQAEAELSSFTEYMIQGKADDYATPVEGDLALDYSDPEQLSRVNGPYLAVQRRINSWQDRDSYKNLSARARKAFDLKQEKLSSQFLESALNQDIAARKRKDEVQSGLNFKAKLDLVNNALLDTSNPTRATDIAQFAKDAIDYGIYIDAKKANILDRDANVIPGNEELMAQIEQANNNAIYSQIATTLSNAYIISNDESEREQLKDTFNALFAVASGHADVVGENEDLINAALHFKFDAATANNAWKQFQDAEKKLKARLHQERIALNKEAHDLFYELQRTPDNTEMRSRYATIYDSLPAADKEAFYNEVVRPYEIAECRDEFDMYALEIRNAKDPVEKKRLFDAYSKKAKDIDDKKLQDIALNALGLERGASGTGSNNKGRKLDAELAIAAIQSSGAEREQAFAMLNQMQRDGLLSPGAWRRGRKLLEECKSNGVTFRTVSDMLQMSGIDLGELFELDINGQPLLDSDNQFILRKPGGKTIVGTRTQRIEPFTVSGYNEFSSEYEEIEVDTIREEKAVIANEILADTYKACIEYIKLQKQGALKMPLHTYINTHLQPWKETLNNERMKEMVIKINHTVRTAEAMHILKFEGLDPYTFNADQAN